MRRNIAFALTRHPIQDVDLVDDLVARSVEDEGRYVRHYALAATTRMTAGTDRDDFLDVMLASRWCPLTTQKSAF